MSDELYECMNCHASIPRLFVVGLGFNICPQCGVLLPETINYIENYFRMIQLTRHLAGAKDLILKSEMVAGVREAVVTLETVAKEKSGLVDLVGPDLMAKAFSFKYDQRTNTVTEEPKIKINNLSDISDRNEQEGIKFLAMGLMQGIRNIYMHTRGTEKLYYCLQIVTTVDLLLKQILGWESIASSSKGQNGFAER